METKHALPRQDFKRGGGVGSVVGSFGCEAGFMNSKRIFLGGLKEYHDENIVREYFSQFGPVASVKLLMDGETGRQRAFGFLEFVDPSSAEKALGKFPCFSFIESHRAFFSTTFKYDID